MRTSGFLWHPLCCAGRLSWQGGVTPGPGSATHCPGTPSWWPDLAACLLICKVGLRTVLGQLGRFKKIKEHMKESALMLSAEGYYRCHCHRKHDHHHLSQGRGAAGGGVHVSAHSGGGARAVSWSW